MTDEKVVHGDFTRKHPDPDQAPAEQEVRQFPQTPLTAEANPGDPKQAKASPLARITRKAEGGVPDIMSILTQITHDVLSNPDKINGVVVFSFWKNELRGVSWAGALSAEEVCHALDKVSLRFRLTDIGEEESHNEFPSQEPS